MYFVWLTSKKASHNYYIKRVGLAKIGLLNVNYVFLFQDYFVSSRVDLTNSMIEN